MKIVLVHRHYPMIGGVTSVVEGIEKELKKKHEIKILHGKGHSGKGFFQIVWKSIQFYNWLWKKLRREKFDVIHTHSFPVCYFAPRFEEKIILTVHGFERGHTYNNWRDKIMMKFIDKIKVRGYRSADKLIAVSGLVKKDLIESHDLPSEKIEVIHNGVDVKRFKPMKIKRKDKKIRVFLCGSDQRKGFDQLVKWAPKIVKKVPDMEFVILGPEKKVPKDLEKYFQFHEPVAYEDMPKLYNEMDIVIMPSLIDPYGMVAMEGMACGNPAIVSVNCGVKEVISDGKDGMIATMENFPEKIIKLSKNSGLRRKMGLAARKKAEKEGSLRALSKKHLALYKSI